MKRVILLCALILPVLSAQAQGKFEVKNFGNFTLHTYATADPLADMSYVIEGQSGLVVLEPATFLDNIKEFGAYLGKLNKPVEKVIANYHAAGASGFADRSTFVMIEGMPEFVTGAMYGGMMQHFAQSFGSAMDVSEFKAAETVGNNAHVTWAGVDFVFSPGASSDFPAASILIGHEVYYMHFTPVANRHMGALQITSREAVEAQLSALKQAKASGANTFIGGHGMATADVRAVDFQIEYLQKVKETMAVIKTGDEFILVMQMAYKEIADEASLTALAANLYK